MKKNIFYCLILAGFIILPTFSFARASNTPPGQAKKDDPSPTVSGTPTPDIDHGTQNWHQKYNEYKAAAETRRNQRLQELGQILIDNRIELLTNLKNRIQAMSNLDTQTKTKLLADLDKAISDLQALKSQISSETDLQALREQVRSIFSNFHVYSVTAPQELGESVIGQGMYILGRLEAIQRQLQTMLSQNKNAGKDVTAIQSLMDQLNAKLDDAKTQLAIADAKFKSMTPANTDAARSARDEGKAAFRKAKDDLKAAHNLLKEIFNLLKTMTATSSPSASISPSISASPSISSSPLSSPSISPSFSPSTSPSITSSP